MYRHLGWIVLLVAFVGCKSAPVKSAVRFAPVSSEAKSELPAERHAGVIEQVQFNDIADQEGMSVGSVEYDSASLLPPQYRANPSLKEFESIALAANPALAEINAQIEALKGKLTQVGLPPNPIVGINSEEIGEDGGAGRYGVYFGRQVVRGNKLELSREVVCAEIKAAEERRAIVTQKLMTDVRKAFFNILILQERIQTVETLVEISAQAVQTSTKLVEAQEIATTALLQAELELQGATVFLKQAQNQKRGADRQLAALIGQSELSFDSVRGDVHSIMQLHEFEDAYDKLVESSPEVSALFADVEKKRRDLSRQIAEPIPDVTWQSTIQYDTVSDNVVSGFQIGMPIPTLNQNQGAIYQARHEIVAAERRAERKALDLRQRLTKAYQEYIDSQIYVEAFENEIIPKAQKTVDLISEAYEKGELPFLQWLTAQRTYSQTQLTYLSQLQNLWDQHWAIQGMLLSGSIQD